MKTLICVYCGTGTTGSEALEHIVPESLGSKKTLYSGAVCTKCNHDLGVSVDGKIFNELMMAVGQVVSGAEGKIGPRKKISFKKGTVSKTGDGVTMEGGVLGKPNEFWIARLLAKVAVNLLTHHLGSVQVRMGYPELIKYVCIPKNKHDVWPFAATYTSLKSVALSELGSRKSPIVTKAVQLNFAWLICSSGFFAIPLRRDSERALEEGKQFIKERIEAEKKKGGKFGMMMSYIAKNNEGVKVDKNKNTLKNSD